MGMRGKKGSALMWAKVELARAITQNFAYMELEYVLMFTGALGAYMFNGNNVINRFGGNNDWNAVTTCKYLAAQVLPEMATDFFGILLMARSGVDVLGFYKEVRNNPKV